MRPRRLELTAFGPFADTVEVDFDVLSSLGVFRIHGNTGAGKTSLLDGMTFALFGQVASSRMANGLRSQHAHNSVETCTVLEFSAQDADWRIVRKPPQWRAAKRGGGLTEQKYQSVQLMRRQGDTWAPVSTNLGEVNTEVKRIVGLDHQQFTQVVVLPQGAFERALTANSNERMQLLRTLFGTDRFDEYSKQLKERADSLRRQRDELTASVAHVDRQVRERACELELQDQVSVEPIVSGEELSPLIRTIRTELSMHETRVTELKAESAEHQSAVAEMSAKARDHQKRSGALRQLEILEQERSDMTASKEELDAAQRVAPAIPALERLRIAERVASKIDDVTRRIRHALDTTFSTPSRSCNDYVVRLTSETLTWAECSSICDSLGELEFRVSNDIKRLTDGLTAQQRVETKTKEFDSHARTVADLEASLNALTDEITKAEAAAVVLQPNVSQHVAAVSARNALIEQVDALDEFERIEEYKSNLSTALAEAETIEVAAKQEQLRLIEQRIANMAGELASKLQDGDPCSVCGATEHPSPASGSDVVTQDALERADEHANAASKDTEAARELFRVSNERLATISGKLGDIDKNGIVKALEEASRRVNTIEADIASFATRNKELVALRKRSSHASNELQREREALASATASVAAAVEHAETFHIGANAPNDLAEARSLETESHAIAVDAKELADAIRASELATSDVARDREHLAEIAKSIGIRDVAEIVGAARNTKSIEHLQSKVDDWVRRHGLATATLEDPAIQAAVEAPNIASAQLLLDETESALHHSMQTATRLEGALREFERLRNQLESFERNSRHITKQCERATRLSDICNGGASSASRMSLERYVLAAHLEEVADAASQRLEAMTAGRYRLRHSDAGASHNAASGLALLVSDAHTGAEREVSTLSGGETFLAALALALGLSDVVQQNAGGVRMDVLFIDEGFGSLDPDRLELAMTHLDQVRAGGRIVGVISHVASLKERIPAGIEVVEGSRGSFIRTSEEANSLAS